VFRMHEWHAHNTPALTDGSAALRELALRGSVLFFDGSAPVWTAADLAGADAATAQAHRWRFGTIPTAVENPLEGPNPTAAQLQAALDSPDVAEVVPQFLDDQNRPVAGPDFSAVERIGFEWDGSAHQNDHDHGNALFATTAPLPTTQPPVEGGGRVIFVTYTDKSFSAGRLIWTSLFGGLMQAKEIADASGTVWRVYFSNREYGRNFFPTATVRSVLFNFGGSQSQVFAAAAAAAAAVAAAAAAVAAAAAAAAERLRRGAGDIYQLTNPVGVAELLGAPPLNGRLDNIPPPTHLIRAFETTRSGAHKTAIAWLDDWPNEAGI